VTEGRLPLLPLLHSTQSIYPDGRLKHYLRGQAAAGGGLPQRPVVFDQSVNGPRHLGGTRRIGFALEIRVSRIRAQD
jgi:hypothetical protein